MKKTIVEWFKNLLKQKSPCCKKPMNDIGYHQFLNGSESIIYECKKCKMQWT